MGFFAWVGSLIDQLIEWLGRVVAAFIYALAELLQALWYTVVAAALIAAYGSIATLYVIFYAGAVLGETVMEIWDPVYYSSKPSEVFSLQQAPQNSPLPTNRGQARVLKLQNWS